MSDTVGRPAGGRPRIVDRAALPDPALFARRSPYGPAVRRIAFAAAALVGIAAVASLGLRGISGRVTEARRAAAAAASAASTALDRITPGAVSRPEPESPPPISPRELAELQKSWEGSESIAPRAERVDPSTGERVLPFHGFGLQVDTTPPGARVLVGEEEMGTSPLLTTVSCQPGDAVQVRAELGEVSAAATTRCRKDVLVKLALALRRRR